jgi:hypothetical protein
MLRTGEVLTCLLLRWRLWSAGNFTILPIHSLVYAFSHSYNCLSAVEVLRKAGNPASWRGILRVVVRNSTLSSRKGRSRPENLQIRGRERYPWPYEHLESLPSLTGPYLAYYLNVLVEVDVNCHYSYSKFIALANLSETTAIRSVHSNPSATPDFLPKPIITNALTHHCPNFCFSIHRICSRCNI